MTSFLFKRFVVGPAGQAVGDSLFRGQEDPYWEANVEGQSRKKKAIPPGISAHDAKILKRVRRKAYALDRTISCFCCCSINIGWATVIGIIPAIGDVIACMLALNVVRICKKANLPQDVLARMYMNVLIDFLLGLVPLIGDVINALYKCNTRNNAILEKFLRARGAANIREQAQAATAVKSPPPPRGKGTSGVLNWPKKNIDATHSQTPQTSSRTG